jgi:hypothetical protein
VLFDFKYDHGRPTIIKLYTVEYWKSYIIMITVYLQVLPAHYMYGTIQTCL